MIDIPTVAILCGGKGTRLGELTANTPKSLVKVAGRPFIFWQLDLLQSLRTKRIVLCVGHLGDLLRDAVGLQYKGQDIYYSHDGEAPRGTLGAVRKAAHLLGDEFLTLYGDSYLPCDWTPFLTAARASRKPMAQTLWKGVDYGISYFSHPWQHVTSLNTIRGIGELHTLASCFNYEMPSRFYQMGDPEGLREVEALLADGQTFQYFSSVFCGGLVRVLQKIDLFIVDGIASELAALRERKGRLFILGVGGSAANASHAVCDFRKLCDIEAYTPVDNVAELTANTNDHGWRSTFERWLRGSGMMANDCLLVLSVGGGEEEAPGTSVNISFAVQYATRLGTPVIGIVGRDGGYTAKHAKHCLIVPTVREEHVTPYTESMQSVICHLLAFHPKLRVNNPRW